MAEEKTAVTLTLSAAQIVQVFKAGISRGSDEATAYEWGDRASGTAMEALREALFWGSPRIVVAEDSDAWWTAFMEAQADG